MLKTGKRAIYVYTGMAERTSNPAGNPPGSAPEGGGEGTGAERRTFHRHPFVAEAEVTELRTGARIAAQTTELSPSGCYLGAADPFAEGARVFVKLTKDGRVFEASAIVLRVHAEFGMGVAFDELTPAQQAILDRWLDEIPG